MTAECWLAAVVVVVDFAAGEEKANEIRMLPLNRQDKLLTLYKAILARLTTKISNFYLNPEFVRKFVRQNVNDAYSVQFREGCNRVMLDTFSRAF